MPRLTCIERRTRDGEILASFTALSIKFCYLPLQYTKMSFLELRAQTEHRPL